MYLSIKKTIGKALLSFGVIAIVGLFIVPVASAETGDVEVLGPIGSCGANGDVDRLVVAGNDSLWAVCDWMGGSLVETTREGVVTVHEYADDGVGYIYQLFATSQGDIVVTYQDWANMGEEYAAIVDAETGELTKIAPAPAGYRYKTYGQDSRLVFGPDELSHLYAPLESDIGELSAIAVIDLTTGTIVHTVSLLDGGVEWPEIRSIMVDGDNTAWVQREWYDADTGEYYHNLLQITPTGVLTTHTGGLVDTSILPAYGLVSHSIWQPSRTYTVDANGRPWVVAYDDGTGEPRVMRIESNGELTLVDVSLGGGLIVATDTVLQDYYLVPSQTDDAVFMMINVSNSDDSNKHAAIIKVAQNGEATIIYEYTQPLGAGMLPASDATRAAEHNPQFVLDGDIMWLPVFSTEEGDNGEYTAVTFVRIDTATGETEEYLLDANYASECGSYTGDVLCIYNPQGLFVGPDHQLYFLNIGMSDGSWPWAVMRFDTGWTPNDEEEEGETETEGGSGSPQTPSIPDAPDTGVAHEGTLWVLLAAVVAGSLLSAVLVRELQRSRS